jgi:hypothetical protein
MKLAGKSTRFTVEPGTSVHQWGASVSPIRQNYEINWTDTRGGSESYSTPEVCHLRDRRFSYVIPLLGHLVCMTANGLTGPLPPRRRGASMMSPAFSGACRCSRSLSLPPPAPSPATAIEFPLLLCTLYSCVDAVPCCNCLPLELADRS